MAKSTKPKDIDITKSGPMTFRDLQAANQAQMSGLSPEFQQFVNNVGATYAPTSLYDARANSEQLVSSQLSNSETPWGESVFDESTATEEQFQHLGDVRAENQPWYSKVANGLTKGAILAGTTFLDGTLGLVFGTATAIGEGRWSGLWDNDFSKAMQAINEASETALPNYYTEQEQNGPWYENIFTANFLGDKFIKNLGFTVGAFYSGGLVSGGIRSAGAMAQTLARTTRAAKAIGGITKGTAATVGTITSAVNEGRIEALNNSKDWAETQYARIDEQLQSDLLAAQQEYEATKGHLTGSMEIGFTDPAYEKYKARVQQLEQAAETSKAKINEDRLKMGNADLLMNLPVLLASNVIQFGKMYANGFRTGRRANNILGNAKDGYTAGTTRAAGVRRAILDPLSEGAEEISQSAASRISGNYYQTDIDNYYKAGTDRESQQETLDWIKAFATGINETVNDGSSWEEFFIGSLTGAMGMPRFRGVRNSQGNLQSPVTLEGGVLGELRENREKMAREQEIVNYMNSRVQSPEFMNYYRGLSRHNFYQHAMDQAVADNDKFAFENADSQQFISDINMFDAAGKIGDLTSLINEAYDVSDENLQSIVNNTTSVVTVQQQLEEIQQEYDDAVQARDALVAQDSGSSIIQELDSHMSQLKQVLDDPSTLRDKHIGPFIDMDGSPMYSTESGKQGMIGKLTEKKDEMLSQIDDYVRAKIDLQSRLPESVSNEQLDELIYLQAQVNNWDKRAESIAYNIKNVLSAVSDAYYNGANIFREQGASDIAESYGAALQIISELSKRNPKEIVQILTNPKNGLINTIYKDVTPFLNHNNSDAVSVIDDIEDLQKIGKAKALYQSRLKEYISNPKSQAKHQQEIKEQQQRDDATKEIVSQVDRVSQSSVSDIVSAIDGGELSADELDSMFDELESDQATDAKEKVEEAKSIIETASRVRQEVSGMVESGEIDQQEADDVLKLLDHSKSVSESSQELIDTDTEAYNTPEIIDIDEATTQAIESDDDTVEGAAVRAQTIEDIRNQRLDKAKNTIRKIGAKLLSQDEELSEVPVKETTPPTDTEEVPNTPTETGHDSVDKVEPVNAAKPITIQKPDRVAKLAESLGLTVDNENSLILDTVLDIIDIAKKRGMSDSDMLNTIQSKASLSYTRLAELSNKDINQAILDFIDSENEPQQKKVESTPTVEATPSIDESDYTSQIESENKRNVSSVSTEASAEESAREGTIDTVSKVNGTYLYWKPTTTQYKIHREIGDDTPYYQSLPQSKDRDRYQAIHEFLVKSGAFDRIRNNQVKQGDEVHFGISKELTEKTGIPIILILNSNNEVIGDLPIPNDRTFGDYIGLSQFYQGATKWYQDNVGTLHQDSDIAILPSYKSNVAKNMVGKAPYSTDRRTLNEISTVTKADGSTEQAPFRLAIAVSDGSNSRMLAEPGRSKAQGASALERTIISPLNPKAGQPYFLLPTSSKTRAFVSVPITMQSFGEQTYSSTLGKAAIAKLQELATISTNTDSIMKWINEMQELLVLPELHVNLSHVKLGLGGRSPQTISVTIKPVGSNSKVVLFNGSQSDPELLNKILYALGSNIPFQVSRKYVNDTYNGQDYNSMIGEIATTNLPVGATHTIDDWFTVDPIVDRKQIKAHSPKSTRVNPSQRQSSVTRFSDSLGNSYYMTSDNKLYKENPNGKDTEVSDTSNVLKAYAYGRRIGESMTSPYNTPWGMYDPTTNKFISKDDLLLDRFKSNLEKSLLPQASKIQFDQATHTYTVDGTPVDISVTQWVHRDETIEPEEGDQLGFLEISAVLGTNLDELARSYFAGNKPTLPKNITKEQANEVWKQLKLLKEQLDAQFPKGWRAITDDNLLRVAGRIQDGDSVKTIAGTMDMLIVDDKGMFHIVDFKTKRVRDNGDTSLSNDTVSKYNQQVSTYADLLKAMHPNMRFGSNFLAVFNVSYPRPKGSRQFEDGNVTYTSDNGTIKIDGNLLTSVPSFNAGTFNSLLHSAYSRQPIVSEAQPKKVEPVTVDRNTALADIKKKGLLNRKERAIYIDKLSDENVVALSQMTKLKSRQLLERLDAMIKPSMTPEEVNQVYQQATGSKPLNRTVVQEMQTQKRWSREAELGRIKKVLPQLSEEGRIKLVDALIKVSSGSNPTYAYGQFQNGVITLSQFGRGTSYHEAFHFVTQSLLSPSELSQLYQDAQKHYGLSDRMQLEEALAEDFRRYMQRNESIFSRIFDTLKHIIKSILGKETTINKLFFDIRRGRLASRKAHGSSATLNRETLDSQIDSIQQELADLRRDSSLVRRDTDQRYKALFAQAKANNGNKVRWVGRLLKFNTARYLDEYSALNDIPSKFSDLLSVVEDHGRYIIVYKEGTKDEVINRTKIDMQRQIRDLENELYNLRERKDANLLEDYIDPQDAKDIESYYNSKLEYENLTQEQADYITERGLPIEEYNSMTRAEKEVFFRCMY